MARHSYLAWVAAGTPGVPSIPFLAIPSFRSRSSLARELKAARRNGHGLYVADFDVPAGHGSPGELIIDWCMETLANTRRPHGIAIFDLAVACTAGSQRRSMHLKRIHPTRLYEPGFVAELAGLCASGTAATVSVALSSWGDIAFAAMEGARG